MLQGLKGPLQQRVSQGFLLCRRQIGIAQDMHDATPLDNAIGADHFSDGQDGRDLYYGNTGFFELGRDRSTAASRRASR